MHGRDAAGGVEDTAPGCDERGLTVLGRVRVAEHHLLRRAPFSSLVRNPGGIERVAKGRVHDRRAVAEVLDRLKHCARGSAAAILAMASAVVPRAAAAAGGTRRRGESPAPALPPPTMATSSEMFAK